MYGQPADPKETDMCTKQYKTEKGEWKRKGAPPKIVSSRMSRRHEALQMGSEATRNLPFSANEGGIIK